MVQLSFIKSNHVYIAYGLPDYKLIIFPSLRKDFFDCKNRGGKPSPVGCGSFCL
jgi:hypothetical protein